MPRVKEKYYYNTRRAALHAQNLYKIYGIKTTVKKLQDRSYVLKVY